jgi:hypothetical protein
MMPLLLSWRVSLFITEPSKTNSASAATLSISIPRIVVADAEEKANRHREQIRAVMKRFACILRNVFIRFSLVEAGLGKRDGGESVIFNIPNKGQSAAAMLSPRIPNSRIIM